MGITTPARVRNRIQATDTEISDDVLNEFIADEQAFVEAYAGKTFAPRHTGTGHTWLLSGPLRRVSSSLRSPPSDGDGGGEGDRREWRRKDEAEGGRKHE